MRKPSLHEIVYSRLHPKPRQNDPVSFYAHVQRNLVPEVRVEVQTYYGGIDCLEAQYPGLDYTFPAHRKRMSRYPWHRRLFRVFDDLHLTEGEILSLCQWEGTRAAKERFERESKAKIEITTLNGVMVLPQGDGPRATFHTELDTKTVADSRYQMSASARPDEQVEQSDEDEPDLSIGVQLNHQLRAAADARARGEPAVFDEQWEQWMKEALERNEMDLDRLLEAIREGRPFTTLGSAEEGSEAALETEALDGEDEINTSPDLEQSNTFRRESTHTRPTTSQLSVPAPQSYDALHSMLDELQTNNNRLAADNAAMAHFLSRSRTETAR